jgi:hypothetical protein
MNVRTTKNYRLHSQSVRKSIAKLKQRAHAWLLFARGRRQGGMAALELADGISAADGRRSDLIMGWALRLRAARGPNATVDPGDHAAILESGLSKEDITEIGQTIALLRKQDHSEVPRPKILQDAERLRSLTDRWRHRGGAVNRLSWSGCGVDGGGSPVVGAFQRG